MPEILYYTSSDPVLGKMTMNQFIETEVEERGNYTLTDVQEWMRKYNLSGNDLAIWVSPKKWVANRYNLLAEEWDKAENIPESEMEVNEIKGNEGFIIPESDDGDEGYLFVFKRNVNPMVRESVTQGDKIIKVIEDAKKKPYSGPEKRDEIRAGLTALAADIDRNAITELRSFRPLGMMSEFGAAMGAEPRKGVKIDTPYGPYVFDEKRVPSNERVERWYAQHKEAEGIRALAAEYAFGLEVSPNTVTGNFRIVERGRRFKEQGLLAPEEEKVLEALEKYWQDHPDLDRQKGYGIWGYNLDIMVPEGLRKNMTEQKGSLIDALLKIEPGKNIIIHYSDIPKDAERIIHLPTDNLSQPTNLTGSLLERKGDLIVVAISADNVITAHMFLQKGSQLIQIRPIPHQKTPIKGGEAITIYYTNWVERIKREAPEYLPEWEKVPKQPWEMTSSEAIAEASKPLGPMGISWGELRTALSSGRKYAESMHKDMVKLAIVEKKHVPAEVLNEYPDLTAKKKEPWEMTRAEFSKQEGFQRIYGSLTGANMEAALSMHKEAIQDALNLDKPVPQEVLKEYYGMKKEVPVIRTYYFRNRPPGTGTYPYGAVETEAWLPMRKTPLGNMAFGWVKYERQLLTFELANYELFVDEIVMPKLVAELIKFTHDEGIFEGFKVLKSKAGWSEYGLAFRDWLKANNEWKPDKGEEAEFLRHLARLTGKTPPETKLEDQEKAKLFLSALSRFTLNELIQQEATVRRWSIKFPQMEKELEDEYKMYLELRRAEKATKEEARKEKASKPQSDQAKELYKQMRKTNSVRELDDWRNKVLFEAHLPDVEEDILLRDLAAKWRIYLETRGVPALEALDKLPIYYTNEDYYFSTEVWIHPTTTIFDDQPLKGRLRQALNGGELFEVAIEGRDGTQRIQIDRIYVTKVIEKPEPGYKKDEKFEELVKQDRIRSVKLYGTTKWQYRDARNIFTMAPDKEAAIERAAEAIKDQPKKDKFAEIQDQMQKDKDKIAGEHLREMAGTMTSKEFTDEALKLNKYREKYEKNPKLLNDYTKSMIQKWKELVEKHGETGKLPDKVIEDYINLFGEQALFSVFRGIKAKGIEGWRLPPAQIESAESLYKRYTSGYSAVSLLGIVRQESKDLAHSIGFELKLNTATYTPAVLLLIAEKFKEFAQRDFDIEHEKHEKKRLKEQAEKEIERQQGGQAFWDEVKNLKVMDFEVEHDINPDKPTRTYYHVYDRTFAVLENGKKIQISYVIYKGEEGKRALKSTKEFYARIYGQYMGKPLSEWVTYDQLISGNRYESYKAQQPKTRFTFIPEAPQAQGVQARYNAYISSTLLTTGSLASPKFLNDDKMAQDIERNIKVSRDEARALVPQFRAIAEKMINKEEIESVKELFGIDVEEEAHKLGIDLADYVIIPAGKRVFLEHKTQKPREYELKPPAGFMKKREEEIQGKLQGAQRRKALTVPPAAPPVAKPVQSIQEIKQQVLDSIQAAGTIEELQPVLKGIGFLPLPEPDKRQLMDAYQNKYSLLMSERPFGVPVKAEEKVRAIGAPTAQQSFEAEQRRKAAESRKISAAPTLTSGSVTARRLEMFEPGAMEKAKAGIEARKRIEQLGLPYEVHPYVRKLAAGTQDVMKFGTKRGKESVEDIVLTRYVKYCPPGTIIDNRNVPKVPERWWVYPPKLRACMGDIEKKLAEAGAGMVREATTQLTPSMISYIRGAEDVGDVIHYYRDNRPPTRGIMYRARDGTYFVEAGGQVYASMGWEDVSQIRTQPACRARA